MGRLSLSKCCLWSINSLILTWGLSWDCNTKNDLIHFFSTSSCIVRLVVVIGYGFLIGGKHLSWCPRLLFLIFLNNLFFLTYRSQFFPPPPPVLCNFPHPTHSTLQRGWVLSLESTKCVTSLWGWTNALPLYLDWASCPYVGNGL